METQLIETDNDSHYPLHYLGKAGIVLIFCLICVAALMDWIPISLLHGLVIVGGAILGLMLGNYLGLEKNNRDYDMQHTTANNRFVADTGKTYNRRSAARRSPRHFAINQYR